MISKPERAHKVSTIMSSRYLLGGMLCSLLVAALIVVIPITRGANPASGTVSEANSKVTWTGQVKTPTGDSNCGSANNAGCDNFVVNFQAPSAGYGPYLLEIKLQPQGDWDMQVYGPGGNLLDGSGNSPGALEIVTLINPSAGSYSVAAAPFAPLVGTDGNSYAASAELKHYVVNTAAQGSDTNISYHNFAATGNLGNGAGEPSIGVNWKTGRAMFIALEQTLRVTFDDSTIPARATWEDKSFAWTNLITMDPILFTDRTTGRTIVSQLVTPAAANSLAVLTDGCSLSAYTDDDGDTWVPDEGCGPPSGADHQSIGGGPFHDPLPRELPAPAYAHAVYYCAQSGVTAYCSRSDNGGLTYGPGVPAYTSECSGLHGHPMVAPDGTVYVPNRSCGGKQGVVVSENNGLTWSVRTVPDSIQGAMDPGVAIGAGGTVYFGYQNGDGRANVAVSTDKGFTWTKSKDIGAAFGINNSAFPRVLAGDDDRAAFAFLGTPTAGPFQASSFTGEWHLYIAHTFNSGQGWTTIDATPTDPVQRGCIWMQGGSNPCRNLLDFMGSAVDKEGRVLIGYADGCINCTGPSNSHASKATIARQVNGRRLFAAYDPIGDPSPTPTPTPTATPTPQPASNVLHFHGNPTDDSGFTGFGTVDVVANGGPFLDARSTLGTTAPAHWDVPNPALNGSADQNAYDPSWIWNLDSPTTLNGDMTIKWWAACSGCGNAAGQPANWNIRLWADGVKVFEQKVTNVTPDLPNVPQLLQATVSVPNVSATTKFVLHVDPVFIDTQINTHIYYDSQSGCPGATGSAPCDSQVIMPIAGANPNPTPTPTGSPTPTPTPGGSENSCFTPGITVVTDATGDQLPPGTSKNDIQKISIAEPNQGAGDSQIVFTMKVADLSGTLPANGQWKTYFTGPDAVNYWVALVTDGNSVVSYSYGTAANNLDTTIGFPDSGTYSPDGTITIGIANAKVGGPTAGQTLTAVNGVAYLLVGVVLNDLDDTSSGSYTLHGSASCTGGGTPTPTPTPAGSPTPTPTPVPNAPQYVNYYPPQGVAESFGEPSIGANWKTGKVMFFGGFSPYALRVGFNDATSPATVTWDQTALTLAATPRVAGDPILFTDHDTGRTFVSQLVGLTPFNGMDFTDDDGTTYLPSQGSGIGAGLDHQTVGGGPFHAPLTGATYPHSVYYCAQEGLNSSGTGIANCALSVNGGLTFGPSIPVYAVSAYNSCFPLHGHIKVGPDGTAYLPNRGCGGGAGMVVSEDNGVTWTARTVPNSSVGSSDASVGIATDGTVFLGYQASDGHPGIAVSHDKGLTWINHTDVGAQVGVKSGIFPAVVAGDGGMDTGRAAFAFYGSATAGDQDSPSFKGEWYLYISSTFDGGKTWTTVNATPGDPIQRDGICTRGFQGCTVPRNLLDFFDATVDKDGRVIVGYEDGCMGGCVQGGSNSNTEKGVIARQSGGKRMFAASDPNPNPTPTPTPSPSPSPSPTVSPTPTTITPTYVKGGITFSSNVTVRASVSGRDGEPSLRVDKLGNAYVAGIRGVPAGVDLWYFDLNPNSSTYDPLMRNPIYRGQPDQFSPDEAEEVGADGGGDVDLAVGFDEASPGSPPYLAFSSLALANVSTARSTDRGATFVKNPLGNATGGVPVDDRQWMEFYGKDSVYLLYRTVDPVIAFVQRSNDGGLTYGPARAVGTIGQVGGISVDQNDGTVYVAGNSGVVAVGTPLAPGLEPLTYTTHTVGGGAHIFFTVKAAKDGTVYVCYSDGQTVFIKYSKDKGNTWSQAVRVSDGPQTATSVLPWMETGPTPGSIGVVWYGTTATSNNDNADWKVFFAQSLNATDASPMFRQVELSDHFIHGSNISESGLPLVPGGAPNRNLLDYFQIGFDPTGAAVVAYTDDHNDFDGHTYVARQISGKGAKGTDIPTPVEGSALPPRTTRDPNAPQVVDFAQDQKNGLLTVLPVNDPLDILSVRYTTEPGPNGPLVVAAMKVSDLSMVPPLSNWRMSFTANAPDSRMSPTGDYSFGLSDRGDQFFVRATTDALGARTFTYGTAVREHQHRGLIAYTDRGTADSGAFDSATNTVTIKVSVSKLNQTLAAGHSPLGPGSILTGLRGGAFTTGDDNGADRNDRAKSDITRGGTQYAIDTPPTAVLSANPTSGSVPLNVTFDGSGSNDPDAGDRLSYTFNFGDGSAPFTQDSPMVIHEYNQVGTFTASMTVKDSSGFASNTATVTITVNNPPPPPCIEDNDARIAFSNGWHLINYSSASDGHFRYHSGNSPQHFANLDFTVPTGNTGSITYGFGKSPKGGTADIYIDGVFKQTINYAGPAGSTQAPEFKPEYQVQFGNLAAGAHKLEIKNLTGVVYVDRFCLQNSNSTAQPVSGPGNTSNQSSTASAGKTSSSNYQMQSGSQEVSVVAESSLNVPFKLALVNPSGLTLQTVDASNGTAVLNASVTQTGVYVIKVINVSLGPLQFTTTTTPLVKR